MTPTVAHLHFLLGRYSYRFQTETGLCDAIALLLTDVGIEFDREKPISDRDRLDFWMPATGVAVEVKVAGSIATAQRQAERYLTHGIVSGVVIAASKAWARGRYPIQRFRPDLPKPFAISYLRRRL